MILTCVHQTTEAPHKGEMDREDRKVQQAQDFHPQLSAPDRTTAKRINTDLEVSDEVQLA